MNYAYLDFEFFNSNERHLNVVCGSLSYEGKTFEYWLDPRDISTDKDAFIAKLKELYKQKVVLVAYNVIAEARALISLGVTPEKFKWVDLYLLYRALLNSNNELAYGKQLIKKREVITSHIPKWSRTEAQKKLLKFSPPEYSLAASCYKLLGLKIDTAVKDKMRDLILSKKRFSSFEQKKIMAYCTSDTVYLEDLQKAMFDKWKEKTKTLSHAFFFSQGEYALVSARMETLGYPVDIDSATNLRNSIDTALNELCEDINAQFPKVKILKKTKNKKGVIKVKEQEFAIFVKDKKGKYTKKTNVIFELMNRYIPSETLKKWPKTDTKKLSLSLEDAWEKFFEVKHDYERGNFGHQMVRFHKIAPNLRSLAFNPKKENFWSFVGEDNRVRPYAGIYGSQTSRSQPKTTGFLLGKPAWMRSLILPPMGKMIIGTDCSAQEFLLSGVLSQDKKMVEAYASSDPYLYFGKNIGQIPKDGTKETHKEIRDILKTVVLAVLYGMGPPALAKRLTEHTGKYWDEDDAWDLLEEFYTLFHGFEAWKEKILTQYKLKGALFLKDGWPLWGDNPNERSVINFPIQGNGAVIMREAANLAIKRKLKPIITQHDALYIEANLGDWSAVDTIKRCWTDAYEALFPQKDYKYWAPMRTDSQCWGIGATKLMYPPGLKVQEKYVDPRGISDYNFFKKYFEKK